MKLFALALCLVFGSTVHAKTHSKPKSSAEQIYESARGAQIVEEAREEKQRRIQHKADVAAQDAQDAVKMIAERYGIDMTGASTTALEAGGFMGQRRRF